MTSAFANKRSFALYCWYQPADRQRDISRGSSTMWPFCSDPNDRDLKRRFKRLATDRLDALGTSSRP